MSSYSDSYKAAGVDVTAGYRAVELMKKHVARTVTSGVLDTIGGFGGMFELDLTGIEKARAGIRYRRCRHQTQDRVSDG